MAYEYNHIAEMETFTGVAWRAEIYDNHRNLIVEVLNYGDGNSNIYRWHSSEGKDEMIKNALEDSPHSIDPLDEFVHRLWLHSSEMEKIG